MDIPKRKVVNVKEKSYIQIMFVPVLISILIVTFIFTIAYMITNDSIPDQYCVEITPEQRCNWTEGCNWTNGTDGKSKCSCLILTGYTGVCRG